MINLDDGRISKGHRQLYDWLKELYPSFNIEPEKPIPSTNQRIDLYIEQLQLAIEFDGEFHFKPNFFIKSIAQWEDVINRDKSKEKFLKDNGITLIRIPFNHKLKSAKDLDNLINETFANELFKPKPFNPFAFINKSDTFKEEMIKLAKEREKANLENIKPRLKEREERLKKEYNSRPENIEYKEKQKELAKKKRQEQYKKFKEKQDGKS